MLHRLDSSEYGNERLRICEQLYVDAVLYGEDRQNLAAKREDYIDATLPNLSGLHAFSIGDSFLTYRNTRLSAYAESAPYMSNRYPGRFLSFLHPRKSMLADVTLRLAHEDYPSRSIIDGWMERSVGSIACSDIETVFEKDLPWEESHIKEQLAALGI